MSYDVSMMINTGNESVKIFDCGNYTYNVSKMYYKAMPDGLHGVAGLKGEQAAPILREAVTLMQKFPEEYKALNPPNGWGNYEGALDYLKTILDACIKHPLAFVATN